MHVILAIILFFFLIRAFQSTRCITLWLKANPPQISCVQPTRVRDFMIASVVAFFLTLCLTLLIVRWWNKRRHQRSDNSSQTDNSASSSATQHTQYSTFSNRQSHDNPPSYYTAVWRNRLHQSSSQTKTHVTLCYQTLMQKSVVFLLLLQRTGFASWFTPSSDCIVVNGKKE